MSLAQTASDILTSSEAAQYLQVHPRTVVGMASRHEIPSFRIGRHWRFRKSDLDLWIADKVQSSCSSFRRN